MATKTRRKKPIKMRAKRRLFVRTLMPSYVDRVQWDNRGGDYAPWVIGVYSTKPNRLSNEALDEKFLAWCEEECEDPTQPDRVDFSGFIDYLKNHWYVVFNVETPGVWIPAMVPA